MEGRRKSGKSGCRSRCFLRTDKVPRTSTKFPERKRFWSSLFQKAWQKLNPPEKTSGFRGLAFCFALLICNSAGSLASGLAGALALAAAALFSGSLQVRLVNSNNVLQKNTSFLPFCFTFFIITQMQKFCNRVRGFFLKSSADFFNSSAENFIGIRLF